MLRPQSDGGTLHHARQVEVISTLERDGRAGVPRPALGRVRDLRRRHEYVRRCFHEYGIVTDPSGKYAAMYKPCHLIGLELGISVASVGAAPRSDRRAHRVRGDVVATAKRALKAGEMLDGEGGYTVWGKLMPARDSLARARCRSASRTALRSSATIAAGRAVSWDDVEIDANSEAVRVRREMERLCADSELSEVRRS